MLQPITSMRSYTEPAALLQHLRGAWSLIWPLHASGDTSKRTIDDPHSSLNQLTKMLPQFEDSHESKKKTRDYFKLRFQKKFLALLEEEVRDPTACAKPSKLPQRHFCAMCGFRSPYTCNSCWARYCCVRCLGTQHETRYTTVS
uniref:HIT-type domain-containing protein n=1 Tax=Oncorhynchus kisutch TaxID=8019 RepID=A0A8C7LAY7_ONCKI